MIERPDAVLFLDVDGTISPLGERTADVWGDQREVPDVVFAHVLTSPALLSTLGQLPVPIVWVTDWQDPTATFTPAMFGRPAPFDHLPDDNPDRAPWWKTPAVLTWLAAHPHVRHVLWADDHLRRRAARAAAAIRALGVVPHLLAPNPTQGLTPEQVQQWANLTGSLPPTVGSHDCA